MNFSFFLALLLPLRASACTGSRLGAGPCFCWLAFPSPPPLVHRSAADRRPVVGFPLLWRSLTPHVVIIARASHSDAARPARAAGRTWGLPVPAQEACVRARFFDHAGSSKCLRWRSWTYCLPLHRQRRHPETVFYRGSMAGLHVPLPTLRRHPHGGLRTARGRCGSLLLHRSGLAPPTPCRSPGAPV